MASEGDPHWILPVIIDLREYAKKINRQEFERDLDVAITVAKRVSVHPRVAEAIDNEDLLGAFCSSGARTGQSLVTGSRVRPLVDDVVPTLRT